MKFSNGCWLQKERCECFSPAEVYFSKIEKDQVTICAPTSKITQRGDTLGGINLTIVISAPYEEVLRVQTYHHMGVQKKAPSFEIAPAESGHLKAEGYGGQAGHFKRYTASGSAERERSTHILPR